MANNHTTTESDLEKQGREVVDIRSYMAVRRELRQQMTEDIKARIGRPVVSRRARCLRWTVFFLTMAAGLVAGYLMLESYQTPIEHIELIEKNRHNERIKTIEMIIRGDIDFEDIEDVKISKINEIVELTELFEIIEAIGGAEEPNVLLADSFLIVLFLRGTILLFLAVGFVAYAINWLRLAYLDDVRTERHYESYGNDIDRASFAIETIMEIGEKETIEVPDAWVEGVCRNLFTDKDDDNYGKVPSNAAAMLFESIAGAKFGPEGTEVTMKRRDARRFAKIAKRGRLK